MDNFNNFKDVFGVSMADVAKRIGYSREYVSLCFRKRNSSFEFLEYLIGELTKIKEENYATEISSATYRKRKAEKIIQDLEDMKEAKRKQRRNMEEE